MGSSLPERAADAGDDALTKLVLDYLQNRNRTAWALLMDGKAPDDVDSVSIQDINDIIYSLYFLDWPLAPSDAGGAALTKFLKGLTLAGGLNGAGTDKQISVHGTAYTLGGLALLKMRGLDLFADNLTPESWALDRLVDHKTLMPIWPSKWSHHNWRVSHWIGGSVSILHELSRQMPDAYRASGAPEVSMVLAAADRLIDGRSGLLKCYRSRILQAAFRQAYRLRHDPVLGDIGGIVHLHWVNYANKRRLKAGDKLFDLARRVMLERRPFMEKVPYCLDFDVVQIARTAMPVDIPDAEKAALVARAGIYASDIKGFLETRLDETYALHKLPGALATLHEAALIDASVSLNELGLSLSGDRPKDVMSEISWL